MTYLEQAKQTIGVWKREGLKPYEPYFAITNQIKFTATWDQVSDLIVGYLMAQEIPLRRAA